MHRLVTRISIVPCYLSWIQLRWRFEFVASLHVHMYALNMTPFRAKPSSHKLPSAWFLLKDSFVDTNCPPSKNEAESPPNQGEICWVSKYHRHRILSYAWFSWWGYSASKASPSLERSLTWTWLLIRWYSNDNGRIGCDQSYDSKHIMVLPPMPVPAINN